MSSYMQKTIDGYLSRQAELEKSQGQYSKGIAFIEGSYVPLAQARIPLTDEGFLHSDLTYDVPGIFDGRLFRIDDHLDRLYRSCEKLRLELPISRSQVLERIEEMASLSGIRDAYVEIIVTRGSKFYRAHHAEKSPNNLYMLVQPFVWQLPVEKHATGGSAVVVRDTRRVPPGAIDPTIKNLQWGDLIRGLMEALDRGAHWPILTDGDGNITEGSGFNVWIVKDGVLHTAERGVLQGITRKTVIDIAKEKGLEVRIEHVPTGLAYKADEIFFCTTAGGIMPVTTLDDEPVGDGKVGKITTAIWERYWELHYDDRFSKAMSYEATGR